MTGYDSQFYRAMVLLNQIVYSNEAPFDASMLSHFRQRIDINVVNKLNQSMVNKNPERLLNESEKKTFNKQKKVNKQIKGN